MNKNDFTGTGLVFRFTLRQHLSSISTKILLLILAVISLAAIPVAALVTGAGRSGTEFGLVYIKNDTPYEPDTEAIARRDERLGGAEFISTDLGVEETVEFLGRRDALLHIAPGGDGDAFEITVYRSPDSALGDGDLSALAAAASAAFGTARLEASGVDSSALGALEGGFTTRVYGWEEYGRSGEDMESRMAVTYAYTMAVMFLCVFSSSFIVRSVVEEKASKLVEVLMLSVRPLALILGKILAMAVTAFSTLIGMAALASLSYFVTRSFLDVSFIADYLSRAGFTGGAGPGFSLIAAVLFSLVTAYMFFALLGGLLGAGCGNMEDEGSAIFGIMIFVMVGYFYSMISTISSNRPMRLIGALSPLLSSFCAPIAYADGEIGFGMLALSWLISLAALGVTARLAAGVYESLLLHRGKRIGLTQLLSLRGTGKGGLVS